MAFDLSNLTDDDDTVWSVTRFISTSGILAVTPNSTSLACGESSYTISGVNNTFYGVECGAGTVTGNYNTAMGYAAFQSANGDHNTAMGAYSINSGTCNYNTANGSYSLSTANGCDYNVAVGYQAMESASSASYNTVLGAVAGQNIQSDYNVAIGYQAMSTGTAI